MYSLVKGNLNHAEEIYRILVTLVKKLKMSKKEDSIVFTETVAEIIWLNKIIGEQIQKYSVVLNSEEVAKIIFYIKDGIINVHDLYVAPRFRKQKLAKMLLIEMISENRDVPRITFHARETNKPVSNLIQFFLKTYGMDESRIFAQRVDYFYVDGGSAVVYRIDNPAHERVEV